MCHNAKQILKKIVFLYVQYNLFIFYIEFGCDILPEHVFTSLLIYYCFIWYLLIHRALHWLSYQIGNNETDPAQETKLTEKNKYLIHC